MKNWPIAVIDILGFKDIIDNFDIEDISKQYRDCIDITLEAAKCYPKNDFIYSIYSDSIVVFPKYNTLDDFLALVDICRLLLYGVFCASIRTMSVFLPMRGAISIGEFIYTYKPIKNTTNTISAEYNTNILIGKAIVDAYEWEKKQEWIGISLTEKTKLFFESLDSNLIDHLISENVLVNYDIPLKEGHTINSYAINSIDKTQIYPVIDSFSRIMEKYNDTIKIKYKNTIDFIKYIEEKNLFYPKRPNK